MRTPRRAKFIAGLGVLSMLLGVFQIIAPTAGAEDGTGGVHDMEHNADLNENQRGSSFNAFLDESECTDEELPQDVKDQLGDYVWHFVTEGQDQFDTLNVEFASGMTEGVHFVAHPDTKHAYVSTDSPTTLVDATATVSPGPDDGFAKFQLSHTCDFSQEEEEDATLIVEKEIDGTQAEDGDFVFTVGTETIELPAGGTDSVTLEPGDYTLTETEERGATGTTVACTNDATGTTSVDFTLAPGQELRCEFVNSFEEEEDATLIVEKEIDGTQAEDGDFIFTVGTETIELPAGGTDSVTLEPGDYTLTETEERGADSTSVTCTDQSSGTTSVDLILAAGQTVTCTFLNEFEEEEDATLIVEKEIDGTQAEDGDFLFTVGTETIELAAGGTDSVTLEPGDYTLTETEERGAEDTSVICTDESSGTTSVDLTLGAGQTVTCTFTNSFPEEGPGGEQPGAQPDATLTVAKDVDGIQTEDGDFVFTVGNETIELAAGETDSVELQAGNYTLTETEERDADDTSVTCTDGSTGDLSVELTLAAGEDVTCTFTNSYAEVAGDEEEADATLTIAKDVEGTPTEAGDFVFVVAGQSIGLADGESQSVTLDAGDYALVERERRQADDTSVSCTDGSTGEASVELTLAAGEDVTCTFTNSFTEVLEEEQEAPAPPPAPAPQPAPAPEAAPAAQAAPEVLGVQTTRLPRTGAGDFALGGFGLMLIGLGAVLVRTSRRMAYAQD